MTAILFVVSLLAFGLTIWAQLKVRGSFNRWSNQAAYSGLTGAEVARYILDRNGLSHVPVEWARGELTDHYDPVHRVVRLSDRVYHGHSIAAVSVAAHECGHALQHKESYGALVLRHRMFPLANFTSGIAPFLLLGGLLFHMTGLLALGILFFAVAVGFQLVTLPVEFNASSRARQILVRDGLIRNNEEYGVKKVLNAAALTYVASALYAVVELLRFIFVFLAANED
ncbi:zinc metallopeptidase [Paenactinomyces guangxiensis]|uniref:Zinc metallopeptidase n=1 Tax=Paenactinomyces guangxiensis TaxID=1490290 RepID=A0A7W1WQ61_9BACL|nr:zinc metallopeptidase [Paenactinomyces guangxiensis]MBA4494002.1 zinc metallopeptidase [Paenactinomyces guangxiensis]MBH8591253.1 zinc metallopeptidase [Paenactinomyces guangxiensis]